MNSPTNSPHGEEGKLNRIVREILPLKLSFLFLLLALNGPTSFAFAPIGETGEIIKGSMYQVGVQPTFLTHDGGSGAEFLAFFDYPNNEESSFRGIVGTGLIDFIGGVTFKYVPFPDVGTQPAIGVRTGAFLSRVKDTNALIFEVAPLFSKKVESDFGPLRPYAAIPLHFVSGDKSFVGTSMAFGADWLPEQIQDYFFNTEVGINLKDSYSYVSFAATFPFDRKQGIRKR